MQTKSSLSGATYICLENKMPWAGIDYSEAYKLHWNHYEKVIRAKFEKDLLKYENVLPDTQFPLNAPFDISQIEEGDFIYAKGKSNMSIHGSPMYSTPVFGWIKKDDAGDLYFDYFKLYSGSTSGSKLIMMANCLFKFTKNVFVQSGNTGSFFSSLYGKWEEKTTDRIEDRYDNFTFIPEKFYITNKNWKPGFQSKAFINLTILWKAKPTLIQNRQQQIAA